MCSGAILLYNIPKVVIGENTLFEKYVEENPESWNNELSKVGNSTDVCDF